MVLLFGASLLPVALVWPQQTVTRAPTQAHADRVRAQVRAEMDDRTREAFESALQAAVDKGARSLQEFLRDFAAAYTSSPTGSSLAQLFGVADTAHGQIVDELQRRLAQVSGWAAVPRLTGALQASASSSHRSLTKVAPLPEPHAFVAYWRTIAHFDAPSLGDILVRTLSASRPRAP